MKMKTVPMLIIAERAIVSLWDAIFFNDLNVEKF